MRKTKIVCTMGPASDDPRIIEAMIDAGMNVARFNLSHGDYDELSGRVARVKEAIARKGKNVALLLDTKGPEVRIGTFAEGAVELLEDQSFDLRKTGEGDETGVSISYPRLVDLLGASGRAAGTELLLDDGKISLEALSVDSDAIHCRVLKGGRLSNRKSINIPGFHIQMPYISQQDRKDLEFGLALGVHYIAASFVRSADDVRNLRDFVDSLGYDHIGIISKIENQSGVDNIDAILEVSDGLMVARGDMGVEIPFLKLPAIQKSLIHKAVLKGKYVITATQMLESMTSMPRPTRAEISDVANAVYDGTSAVMLSGESAMGRYPVESVRALASICEEAENNSEYSNLIPFLEENLPAPVDFRENICMSAKEVAERIGAAAIITETLTGRVARTLVRYRPPCPIVAVTTTESILMSLTLNWGITAVRGEEMDSSDAITQQAIDKALETGVVKRGDTVVVISSNKANPTQGTDTLNIRIV